LYQPRLLGPSDHETPVLVVAPAIALAGVVRDASGALVGGARIRVRPPEGVRAGLDLLLEESHTKELSATTDDRGGFELPSVPAVPGTMLVTKRPGYETTSRPLPEASDLDLEITLHPRGGLLGILRGRVVDAEGAAVREAWVRLGSTVAAADETGRFELFPTEEADRVLLAVAPDYLPLRVPGRPGVPLIAAFPDPLLLVLDAGALHLTGEVRRADGSPAGGVAIWTPDTTPFGKVPIDPEHHDWAIDRTVESMVRELPFGLAVDSSPGGRFVLEGLLDHPYVVCGFDPATLTFVQSAPVRPRAEDDPRAGPEVVLRLPEIERRPLVGGVVTSLGGEPVAGARVRFGVDCTVRPSLEGREAETEPRCGPDVRTDSTGRFEVRDLARAARWIRIEGGGLARAFQGELDPREDLTALVYRLPLRCRLQVVCAGDPEPTALMLLDDAGEVLAPSVKRGWVESAERRCAMVGGRSEVLKTSELARTLVLLRGETEILRAPLRLVPGELTVLHL